MLDIEFIRNNPDAIKKALERRGASGDVVDVLLAHDAAWREYTTQVQELRHQQKTLSAERDIEGAKAIKEQIKEKEVSEHEAKEARDSLLITLPNIPFDDVPDGKDENDNIELRCEGNIPTFNFPVQDHIALGEALDIIDTKQAAEVSGARFYYLKKEGALLEWALLQYAMSILTKEGFEPVIPPVMIRPDVYTRMGRLTPDQKDERFYIEKDDLYLIGSAEHTLGPLLMDRMVSENETPKRFVGFSTCFRREAGSYGKDTKGILRVHQFDKVEMFSFTLPEQSEKEHQFLLSMQEKLYAGLNIPYRVVEICTGDMGPTDARQYDIEAWIPSQETYREVCSCSNTTTYQTRGINAKVQRGGESEYLHALNATAIAMSRTIIAIIENNQQKDGNVVVPKVLRKFVGKKKIG
jgi:seryl-tRNA synthetase